MTNNETEEWIKKIHSAHSATEEPNTLNQRMDAAEIQINALNEAVQFDDEPTANSTKLIQSGKVYTALAGKELNLEYDTRPIKNSQKLLTSGALYEMFSRISEAGTHADYSGTDKPVYIFQIDPAEDDPALCISYPSYGANAGFTPATKDNWGDWANTFIAQKIKPCTVLPDAAGMPRVNYYLNTADIKQKADGTDANLDGRDGDVCTAIPKIYSKWTIVNKGWISTTTAHYVLECGFSEGQFTGSTARAHTYDNTVRDMLFVGCFEGYYTDSKLRSIMITANPTVSQRNDTFQSYANANNTGNVTGYSIETYNTHNLINMLYCAVFANLNSQTVIGNGNSSSSGAVMLGDTYRNQAGGANYGTTANSTTPMRLFYIENWWGNLWKFLTGIIKDANDVYHINTKNCRFVTQNVSKPTIPAEDHITISSGYANTTGYIKKFMGIDAAPFLPAAVGASSNTYASDYAYYASGLRTVAVGGSWGYGANCGAFAFDVAYAPSNAPATFGARLQILGADAAAQAA